MVGEAFNTVTPLGSFGGEPVKAGLLKKHHGVGLREATAALVLAQTINIMALVLFLIAGFGLMLRSEVIPSAYRVTAGSALAGFTGCVLLLFLTQRHGMVSRVARRFAGARFGGRAESLVVLIHDVEHRLIAFYTGQRGASLRRGTCLRLLGLRHAAHVHHHGLSRSADRVARRLDDRGGTAAGALGVLPRAREPRHAGGGAAW